MRSRAIGFRTFAAVSLVVGVVACGTDERTVPRADSPAVTGPFSTDVADSAVATTGPVNSVQPPATTPPPDQGDDAVGVIRRSDCDEESFGWAPAGRSVPLPVPRLSCVPGFMVGDAFFETVCSPVAPDAVGRDVLAVGDGSVAWDELRTIDGVDPDVMMAVFGDGCGSLDGWFVVQPGIEVDEALAVGRARAWCTVVVDQPPEHRCDRGGNAVWTAADVTGYAQRFAYFPEYVSQIDAGVATDDPAVVWRADPIAVVREWAEGPWYGLCSSSVYLGCRIVVEEPAGADPLVLAGVVQWIMPMWDGATVDDDGEPVEEPHYETYPIEVRLERLGGGGSWWLVEYTENPVINHGAGTDARHAYDQAAQCCPAVVVER